MVLVGPSGCGKSTLLRMIAGLEEVTAGSVSIGDARRHRPRAARPRHRDGLPELRALPAHDRAQEPRLRAEGAQDAEGGDRERVERVARLLGLDELLDRRPAALSGGQRQRVAMGRAIVREPTAFLMDEPLSNLDAKLRVSDARRAREPARAARRDHGLRHARPGRGDDARPARRRHARRPDPAGGHAAGPLPRPRQSLRRRVHRLALDEPRRGASTATRSSSAGLRIALAAPSTAGARGRGRPRHPAGELRGRRVRGPALPQLDAEVAVVEELGSDVHVIFPIDAPRVEAEDLRPADVEEELIADDRHRFTARVHARTAASPGEPLRLAVDPAGSTLRPRHGAQPAPRRGGPGRRVDPEVAPGPATVACAGPRSSVDRAVVS